MLTLVTDSPKLSAVELPRVRYVLWNIYQINNLFNTYYTGMPLTQFFNHKRLTLVLALQNAVNDVQLMIATLTSAVDLVKKPSVTFFDILSAMTMGLVFLGVRSRAGNLDS